MKNYKVLHIVTVSFVINHFFGKQFKYLSKKTNNDYYLGCTPSEEFFQLAEPLEYTPFAVDVTRNISPITDLKAIYKIYKFIKKNNIEIVVGHTPKGGMVSMIAAALSGVKTRIYFRHGIIYETSTGLKRFLLQNIDRLSGTLATEVVCVSNSVKAISEADHLNARSKNIVLGLGTCNGIDTENKFNPEKQDEYLIKDIRNNTKITDKDFVIGYVGRLVKDKGINELIEAWKTLREEYDHIKLLLVGPIEERDSISEESKRMIENDPRIINTGFVLNAAPYFKLMDVFVLPTYREGFPTVSLEASSMNLPVLITKATGCTESIIENKTGVFIKNNAEDIIEKIEFYIENPEMKQLHGDNGRSFVRENFEETKVWDIIHTKLGY
ncbi:glycosyltransferase family 4 protein [Chryseobacterium sp. YR221]|uniref:glycosyltransferase family 4 protein n=1 Tax=Chryseobacterium sp. YR221 TaxID=1500293 RepID=UPI0009D8E8E1|nr:glycosyltransferase family 4 protein [Chryseobacterium sp. YR221]SMC47846.1 Glycosyltransferase involved in cell wall bisynthesis [Chryseobacterium sp. YR221]